MQVMYLAVRQNAIQSSIRSKTTKADVIKELHKKNKLLFGELLETRKQKLAREKREKKASRKGTSVQSKGTQLDRDTELEWVEKNQKTVLKKIKFTARTIPYSTKQILRKIAKIDLEAGQKSNTVSQVSSSANDTDSRNDTTPSIVQNIRSNTSLPNRVINAIDASSTASDDADESKTVELPPEILVNKLTLFPYLDDARVIVPRIPGLRQILSISPSLDPSKLSIPSVTRILRDTMSDSSKLNLESWKQRMILKLGQEGFDKYSQELLLHGKQFHAGIQRYLSRKETDVSPNVELAWQSIEHVVREIYDVQALESHTVHSKLYYRGIVDCVACYRGNLCAIDWKKSDKPKNVISDTYDAPLQVASYVGALNSDENYDFQVRNGLVVVAYTNGDPATVHEIDPLNLNKYWKLWLRRLQEYYIERLKKSDATSGGTTSNTDHD